MKTFGIVLAALGGAMVMSGLKLVFTEYDMNDTHDMSKAIGGMSISVGMIAVGAYLVYANRDKGKDKSQDNDQEE